MKSIEMMTNENILYKIFKVKDKDQLMRKRKIDGYKLGLLVFLTKVLVLKQSEQGEAEELLLSWEEMQSLRGKVPKTTQDVENYNSFLDAIAWLDDSRKQALANKLNLETIADIASQQLNLFDLLAKDPTQEVYNNMQESIKQFSFTSKNLVDLIQKHIQSILSYNKTIELMADIYKIDSITLIELETEEILKAINKYNYSLKAVQDTLKAKQDIKNLVFFENIPLLKLKAKFLPTQIEEVENYLQDFSAYIDPYKDPLKLLET